MPPEPNPRILRIAEYRLDARAGLLFRVTSTGEQRVPLQDLPLRLLTCLAEQPGTVVTRETLRRRLWPGNTFVDFEDGLNTAMRKLRQAIETDAQQPAYIETVRGFGYRLLAPVEPLDAPLDHDPVAMYLEPQPVPAPARTRSAAAAVYFFVLPLAGFVFWWNHPTPAPTVSGVEALTTRGNADFRRRLTSDGPRLYFVENEGGAAPLMQTSLAGGEPVRATLPLPDADLLDVSSDASRLLIASRATGSLFSLPAQGGTTNRIAELQAVDAVWSHDGRAIAFARTDGLWWAQADGRNPRRLAEAAGVAWPAWSPDDRRLRYNAHDAAGATRIYEVSADGGAVSSFAPGWGDGAASTSDRMGAWSADGVWFFFTSDHGGAANVWAVQERAVHGRRPQPAPLALTHGPQAASHLAIAGDGRALVFYGWRPRPALCRFDPAGGDFEPLLAGLLADEIEFARDGEGVVYSSGGRLWVTTKAGSDPLALTQAGSAARAPRWSPDGRRIAFLAGHAVQLIGRDGGGLRTLAALPGEVRDLDWSPDGRQLAVAAPAPALLDAAGGPPRPLGLGAMRWLRWSSSGMLAAGDGQAIWIRDGGMPGWRLLVRGGRLSPPVWSRDGRWLYYQELSAPAAPLFQIAAVGGAPRQVASFAELLADATQRCVLAGLDDRGGLVMAISHARIDLFAARLAPE